jgi:hypothetical protein
MNSDTCEEQSRQPDRGLVLVCVKINVAENEGLAVLVFMGR